MFGFCWHDWYVINKYTDNTIKCMAEDPSYDPDLDDYIGSPEYYKEKICLKCKKYIDEITPRYMYHLRLFEEREKELKRVEALVVKVRKGGKIWERQIMNTH